MNKLLEKALDIWAEKEMDKIENKFKSGKMNEVRFDKKVKLLNDRYNEQYSKLLNA